MENLTSRYYYKYTEFKRAIRSTVEWLKPQRDGYTKYGDSAWEPDEIVSINRGGLVAGVYLSHALEKPHYPISYQTRDVTSSYHDKSFHRSNMMPPVLDRTKKILLVDDINDSGKTFTDIMEYWSEATSQTIAELRKNIKTVSLIEREGSVWTVDYTPLILDTKQWVVFPWEAILDTSIKDASINTRR